MKNTQNNKSIEEIVEEHLKDCVFCHEGLDAHFVDHVRVGNLVRDLTSLTTQIRKEAVEEIEKLRKLLKECEPFLSDGTGVGIIDLVYRTPVQQMREAADRLEYESDLKRRVQETLTNPNPNPNNND